MSAKTPLMSRLAKVFSAGLVTALIVGCTTPVHTSVQLPNEPRKFKIGKEAPESFEFFRTDEEIRGRLLAGVWKSREIKGVTYTEFASSFNGFKPYRKNYRSRTFWTYIFFENGTYTANGEGVTEGERTKISLSGRWIVKNGELGTRNSDSNDSEWEFVSVIFTNDKTMLWVDKASIFLPETTTDLMKKEFAKNGDQYFPKHYKEFRDEQGNRYIMHKYEMQSGAELRKNRTTTKSSPFILELQ